MESSALTTWYAANGRHDLPWRAARDPWAVLVSEVMLQQTSVARVLPRWGRFLHRWPDPRSCAAAGLDEVLREWQGLGYPRRARALHLTAGVLTAQGWPQSEAGLQTLPGVGPYTAAALARLAFGWSGPLPRDVNIDRVAARALLGAESDQTSPRQRARVLAGFHSGLVGRTLVFALFDLGALVCTARRPGCSRCPLRPGCLSAHRLTAAAPPPRAHRQAAWRGSLRELRGAVLREFLGDAPPTSFGDLERRVGHLAAAAEGGLRGAVASLARDGLIAFPPWWAVAEAVQAGLLPRAVGDNVTAPLPPDRGAASYHPRVPGMDAERILIVDDDPGVRGYLRAALSRSGHEVIEAGTAAEALAAVEAAPVGVMLIDGLLPDGHGLDLAAQVLGRPEGARVAISFVTGAVREPVPPTLGIGALGKPVRPSELLAGVDELLTWRSRGDLTESSARRAALDNLASRFLVGR